MEVLFVSIFTKEIVFGKGRLGNLIRFFPKDTQYTLLTTDFDHRRKEYYQPKTEDRTNTSMYTVKYIHIPSYTKNLSFLRIWGNFVFGWGVRRFLKQTTTNYDLIYCIVPSASGVLGCRSYLSSHKTNLAVDVMDLLPESLLPLLGDNWFIKCILKPWFTISKKAYQTADIIIGESKEYANIAHRCNPQVPYIYTYLGIDMLQINEIIKNRIVSLPNDGRIKICYGGNLGNSYDFDAIIDTLAELKKRGIKYKMYFVGGGDKEDYVKSQLHNKGIDAMVTGVVPYHTYIEYLSQCDIGLNVFKSHTKIVHSYKFNDYAACGLFIVNNLHGETENMIKQYQCGITSDNICDVLVNVCTSWETYRTCKSNCLKMVDRELSVDVIYKRQAEILLSIIQRQKKM